MGRVTLTDSDLVDDISIKQQSENTISRFLVELETGGNIRLEQGKPSELWYSSCVDLLRSRFQAQTFESKFNIEKLSITNVTRIHNRFLRNRFETEIEVYIIIPILHNYPSPCPCPSPFPSPSPCPCTTCVENVG